MKLINKELLSSIPALYEQDGVIDKVAYVKFFTPDANWTWFAMEYDSDKEVFFGLVDGLEREFGYFTLYELENAKGVLGLPVERDIYFEPTLIKDLK